MTQIISITGLDGCGKSTQAKLLAEKLPESRIVSVWDIIQHPEFQKWSIYQQAPKVENYVMQLHPLSRSLFIFHAFNEAYQKANIYQAEYLIFDGNWYKYWAIEQAMGAPENLGKFLQTQYKQPDFSFYLELEIDDIVQRKQEISVYEGGFNEQKINRFKQIQSQAKNILENLLPAGTHILDARKPPMQLHREILEYINKN